MRNAHQSLVTGLWSLINTSSALRETGSLSFILPDNEL